MQCHIDHGLKPVESGIKGRVIFRGEFPTTTDQVRIAVARNFPPSQINQLLFSDPIDFRADTAQYELFVPQGTYEVVGVMWKEHNQSWNISDLIGVYGGLYIDDVYVPAYNPVSLPSSHSYPDSIDILADFSRVNRDAKIQGTVIFEGDWPSNSGLVAVAAFTAIPEVGNFTDYYFKSIYIDYSIQPYASQGPFQLRVSSQIPIPYIAVLWIDDEFNLGSALDVGFYEDPEHPGEPGSMTLSPNSIVTGIQITVRFDGP